MTWVTLLHWAGLEARWNKLANSWTAEPPFVPARAPNPPRLTQGEGRREASSLTGHGGRSHPRQILRVKQAYQMLFELNFVAAIGSSFESHQLAHKGSPDKTPAPSHLM